MSKRGNYRDSKEADSYHSRREQAAQASRLIDLNGTIKFGKWARATINQVDDNYLGWASEQIPGFANRLAEVKRHLKLTQKP
jgi:hypothetical protein